MQFDATVYRACLLVLMPSLSMGLSRLSVLWLREWPEGGKLSTCRDTARQLTECSRYIAHAVLQRDFFFYQRGSVLQSFALFDNGKQASRKKNRLLANQK